MLQDPEIILHRLRLRYLTQMQDGIGEKIIDFSQTKTNTTAFRIAGGDPAIMERCVSPDIPIYDSLETNPRNGLVSPGSAGASEEAEMGGALRRTITDLSLTSKRSRNNLHDEFILDKLNPALRDDEASDQSDISDNEDNPGVPVYGSQQKHLFMMDLHRKIAEEPKFQKMPVRRRGISDTAITYKAGVMSQPPRLFVAQNGSENDLSRTSEQSVVSSNFMLPRPEVLGITTGPDLGPRIATDSVEDFRDVLAPFERTVDDSSEDDYDLPEGSLLTDARILEASPWTGRSVLPRNTSSWTRPVLGSLPKSKPRPESVFQPTSGLTALIKANESAEVNPLERKFGVLNGKGDLKPLKLKIYRPSSAQPSKSFDVVIKSSATVVDTIGYALLRYVEEKREPPMSPEQKDPNHWTLRIVEDDGELDDDFPALERSRPISKFAFDEFAIVEATAAQLAEYEALDPHPLDVKVPDLQVQPLLKPTSSYNKLQVAPPGSLEVTVGTSVTPGFALAGAALTSSPTIRPPARAPGAPVLLKVRLRPDASTSAVMYAQSTVLDVTTETYLGDVLDQVCKRRNLDKYMFLLRLPGSNVVVPSDRTVESLQGRTELLLVRKRATDLLTDTIVPRSMTPNAPIVTGAYSATKSGLAESSSLSKYVPDVVTSYSYQHWIVWRRQPMSFMGRHERILAIDGEYVHVSPSESKTIFESVKTSSIHVGQIVACKQSRKIPVNFKIMILKAGQTKRYDFEATKPQEAETIITKIKTLTRNWASRRTLRQSRVV